TRSVVLFFDDAPIGVHVDRAFFGVRDFFEEWMSWLMCKGMDDRDRKLVMHHGLRRPRARKQMSQTNAKHLVGASQRSFQARALASQARAAFAHYPSNVCIPIACSHASTSTQRPSQS